MKKNYTQQLPEGFTSPSQLSGLPHCSAILVGFSGGADSTALLHILKTYADIHGARLCAAHVNHGIRGDEADRDESFCRLFANKFGIEFFSKKVNIPEIAKISGESIETAARRIRYEYFSDLMKEQNIPLLATAHNADDNLETIIFNIARGTGLSGVCGIPPCRACTGGILVRPILGMEKSEILEYCAHNQLEFVTDSTNLNTEYTRNKIRKDIAPKLKELNSGAVKNAYRMSQNLREDSSFIENTAVCFAEELGESHEIDTERLISAPCAVTNRVLMHLYAHLTDGKTLEEVHIKALRALAEKNIPHSSVSLPNGIIGVMENGKLVLCTAKENEKPATYENYFYPLYEGSNIISQTNCEIFISTSHNSKNVYKKSILLSLDFDKINGQLIARSRESGDKIKINGFSKSLKKLMNEKKIPLSVRSRIPVICDDNEIVAVPLLGICDKAKAKKSCENFVNIDFCLY